MKHKLLSVFALISLLVAPLAVFAETAPTCPKPQDIFSHYQITDVSPVNAKAWYGVSKDDGTWQAYVTVRDTDISNADIARARANEMLKTATSSVQKKTYMGDYYVWTCEYAIGQNFIEAGDNLTLSSHMHPIG